jgi:hypothetical protein
LPYSHELHCSRTPELQTFDTFNCQTLLVNWTPGLILYKDTALAETLPSFMMYPYGTSPASPTSDASNLKKKRTFPKTKLDRKGSLVEATSVVSPFIGPSNFDQNEEGDAEPIEDSEPEDHSLVKEVGNTSHDLTIQGERETLLNEVGLLSWDNYENFKAAHAKRVERCYEADKADQNRTILHWLALKSSPTSITQQNLDWLVELALAYDSNIITQVSGDSEANCLHVAVQEKRADLVRSVCQKGNAKAVEEAITQGNHSQETCLHLAVKLHPPDLLLVKQLLAKCTEKPKAIIKQRSSKNPAENLNTVLHDFVHIDQCFEQGYINTLRSITEFCPEAMKVQNAAKETPFQFHLATRDKQYPEWKDLEFSPVQPKTATRNLQNGDQGGAAEKQRDIKDIAARVGRQLLDESFSQSPYKDAVACLYGESK